MEEVTPALGFELCVEVSAAKEKGQSVPATGTCLSKALSLSLVADLLMSTVSPPPQGLCKLGSAGGTDYGLRQFAEGSTEKLAKQCRKWLCNASIDTRTRQWAVEGLAYLTLDADVKDDFVQDSPALQAMFELAKTSDKTILYSVATTLVNCTNSYDVKVIPELVQLAKFSKQHVPEEHPNVGMGAPREGVSVAPDLQGSGKER